MPDIPKFAGLALATLAAGFLRGYSGFGGGLVMAPFFTRVVGPADSVALISLIHVLTGFQGVRVSAPLTDKNIVLPLLISAVICVPAGVYLLEALEPQFVKTVVAAIVIVFAIAVSAGAELRGGPTVVKSILVGSVSGILNGFCGIGGPPAVLYLLGGGRGASNRLRASFIIFFAVLYPATVLTLALAGFIGLHATLTAVLLAPIYFGTTEGGRWCFHALPSRWFVPVCTAVLCLSGVSMLFG